MGLAQDLLAQANHLATYEGINPSQAALRRSVSTAYYALFLWMVHVAAMRWLGGSSAATTGLERAFSHGSMKNGSVQFNNLYWEDWHGVIQAVPDEIRNVAKAFTKLQQQRHIADYDNHLLWSSTDVRTVLTTAASAFANWEEIREHPLAGSYLLLMLIGKGR